MTEIKNNAIKSFDVRVRKSLGVDNEPGTISIFIKVPDEYSARTNQTNFINLSTFINKSFPGNAENISILDNDRSIRIEDTPANRLQVVKFLSSKKYSFEIDDSSQSFVKELLESKKSASVPQDHRIRRPMDDSSKADELIKILQNVSSVKIQKANNVEVFEVIFPKGMNENDRGQIISNLTTNYRGSFKDNRLTIPIDYSNEGMLKLTEEKFLQNRIRNPKNLLASAGNKAAFALGVLNLGDELLSAKSTFNRDVLNNNGSSSFLAKIAVGADVAAVSASGGNLLISAKGSMEATAKATSSAETVIKNAKLVKGLGIVGVAAAVVSGGANILIGHHQGDGHRVTKAVGSTTGALAGGIAGAKGGAAAGAAIGAFFAGAGAAPGAVIGGFIGGVGGAFLGAWGGGEAADKALEMP